MINRNNYEEYLLLYTDDELPETVRKEVELFVQQHPDVQEELDTLLLAKLLPPAISFDDKSQILKHTEGITNSNCESYFLLSIDGELSAEAEDEVEQFILSHPNTQENYTLLKQSKLQPQAVIFPHKQILYKKEPSIAYFVGRFSIAAAVLLCIVGLYMAGYYAATKNNNVMVAQHTQTKTKQPVQTPASNDVLDSYTIKKNEPATNAPTAVPDSYMAKAGDQKQKEISSGKILFKPKNLVIGLKPVAKNVQLAATAPVHKPPVLAEPAEEPQLYVAQQKDKPTVIEFAENTLTPKKSNELFSNAVYNEVNNHEEDRTIYIGNISVNKNKLKGLLRKAGRVINIKNLDSDGDNTIQVAAFNING